MVEMDAAAAENNNQTKLQEAYLKGMDQLVEGELVQGHVYRWIPSMFIWMLAINQKEKSR